MFHYWGRYIPDATGAIYDVLKEMTTLHASKKKRYNDEDAELLKKVSSRLITKGTLMEKLAEHVEQVSFYLFLNLEYCLPSIMHICFKLMCYIFMHTLSTRDRSGALYRADEWATWNAH